MQVSRASVMRLFVSCGMLDFVSAWPKYLSRCKAWAAGDDGMMDAAEITDGAGGGACMIDASAIPASGYKAGVSYSISVSSNIGSMYKLHSSDEQCLGDDASYAVAGSKVFPWTAPASGSSAVTFYALCAPNKSIVLVAPSAQKSGDPSNPATQVPAPAPAPQKKVVRNSDLELGKSGLKLTIEPVGEESISLEVTLDAKAWIGFGLSKASSVSMSGGGEGSDIVTCADGEVKRWNVIGYRMPDSNKPVPGASCTHANGKTTLKFHRTLASHSDETAVTPGIVQQIIFARGGDGETTLKKHAADATRRGGIGLDFATSNVVEAPKRSGEAVLYLHFILMCMAWGAVLPLGAIMSRCFRESPNWFWWHRTLQTGGWAMQLMGFVMSVIYCQMYSAHFQSPHTFIGLFVVIIGTLQPLNAFFRPHNPHSADESKTTARVVWEYVHKWGGWVAIVFGVINTLSGVFVLQLKEYNNATTSVALAMACVCVAASAGALIYGCVGKSLKSKTAEEVQMVG